MMVLDKNDPNYRQCRLSVMDNIADPDITFDENGISNYYYEYLEAENKNVIKGQAGVEKYKEIITKIKADGHGKKYDCILGVSGGVDSTYLAYLAKQDGLRVLCVHFDNGWNSELAVKNIQSIVEKCGFDLYTYVIDWEEFKDVQLSFLKASVIDIEAITDIAIFSSLIKIAVKFRINKILSGNNVVTEYVLPKSWIFKDVKNLLDIHNKFGSVKIKKLPLINKTKLALLRNYNNIEFIEILNFVRYEKAEVKKIIVEELNWVDYGGKHYESVFTRFYQGVILVEKFKVDKRKAHLSNLIFSGQITKDEALLILMEPIINSQMKESDTLFVLKKLGVSEEWFKNYLNSPGINHRFYNHTKPFFEKFKYLEFARPFWIWLKKQKK